MRDFPLAYCDFLGILASIIVSSKATVLGLLSLFSFCHYCTHSNRNFILKAELLPCFVPKNVRIKLVGFFSNLFVFRSCANTGTILVLYT